MSLREEQSMYTLTLNEKQAEVLVAALDLYTRIGIGQFEEIVNVYDRAAKLPLVIRDGMRNGLNFAKQLVGHPKNGSYGIHHPDVDDDFRASYDLKQVIRHRLAWDRAPKGGVQVDFDEPWAISKESLATIENSMTVRAVSPKERT